ncbi:MAG TPA: BlaI/MecI/CopY family transcriptional regulator [Vicinamibacterales bacterium]|nr:BlaI/MecI/CopY family transcriptional regulator [Vicinamibacterales bacterium]
MARRTQPAHLSRRERQIMDILYRTGRATAAEVRAGLHDAPSDSAVRTLLRILEEKGHIRHEMDGLKFVYLPTIARDKARRSALKHVIDTFFDGSASQVVAALVDLAPGDLDEEEMGRLQRIVDRARRTRN